MIKAVIFDIDGVLVDSRDAGVALFQNVLIKAGYPEPSREAVLACFHLPALHTIEKLIGSSDQKEVRRVWALVKEPSSRRPELLQFPAELESILEGLHKKYRLAIVTSRIQIGVEEIFNQREIRHLFDVVVTFDDYKNPKPHPEPLLLALKRLGLSADEAVYIGDAHVDIEAARDAGMKSIHLADTKHNDANIGVKSFSGITKAVESLDT